MTHHPTDVVEAVLMECRPSRTPFEFLLLLHPVALVHPPGLPLQVAEVSLKSEVADEVQKKDEEIELDGGHILSVGVAYSA